MRNIDIVATENGFNIITLGGGGNLFLNGEEILTLENYIDKVYPKGIEFIFPAEFNPIPEIGGDWTCVASNIEMPIGGTINFIGNSQYISTSAANDASVSCTFYVMNSTSTLAPLYIYNRTGFTGNQAGASLHSPSGTIDLSQATRTKLVSIWKRG